MCIYYIYPHIHACICITQNPKNRTKAVPLKTQIKYNTKTQINKRPREMHNQRNYTQK